ncbi:MAG: glycosyltransferase [Deltaproteobacteria bacterium]|nr:glycosyltransferase [Deltaproteobacteria bacterium]
MSCGGAGVPPQRVCFFGTFARQYTVSRALMRACTVAGAEVVECHEPLWEAAQTKSRSYFGPANVATLLVRYAGCARRLARRLRTLPRIDAFVVGFQGQLDMLLLRRLLREKRRIVFAPLVTLTETLIDDRQVYPPTSLRARLAHALDAASLRSASTVVLDTEAHRDFVVQSFRLPRSQTSVWYLGCDDEMFRPRPLRQPDGITRVVFYGSFLPLHGTRTILEAAALLADDRDIQFELAGDGPERAAAAEFVQTRKLVNVRLSSWQRYESLQDLIQSADICLGIFGGGQKAQMVIPNKVYQCAAVGRAIISADSPAIREVFAHADNIWLCPPVDAAALAQAIRTLSRDSGLCSRLGGSAADLMSNRFSPSLQAQRLVALLQGTGAR